MKDREYIVVKTQQSVSKVYIDDIIYIMRNGRKLNLITTSRNYGFYSKIEDLHFLHEQPFYFVRKGLCINLERTVNMEGSCIEFEDGTCVYTGRDSFIKARQRFYRYLLENQNEKTE